METKNSMLFYKKHLTNHTKSEAKHLNIFFFWRFQMADYSLITKHKLLHMMKKMSRNSDSYVKRPGKIFPVPEKFPF